MTKIYYALRLITAVKLITGSAYESNFVVVENHKGEFSFQNELGSA